MKIYNKMGLLLAVWIVWAIVGSAVDPIIANQLAMNQMNNTVDSSLWIQVYSTLKTYELQWFGALAVLMFMKEICQVIEKLLKEIKK